ncbi:hypothetical protein PG993_008026 [Apiospora rasikravindrae]|uniref:DUF3431 domain containing protein n=1 Tax=Apiospora rasikravindrae TaxID=990691 RepID=A0ABR1SZ64_9PEZI
MIPARSGLGRVVVACAVLVCFSWFICSLYPGYPRFGPSSEAVVHIPLQPQASREIDVVVASTKSDNTTWFHRHLPPQWQKSIYVVDDPKARLTVPQNKGREAMVYLTHIVTNYDDLSDHIIFFHASRFAWHNDDPDYDGLATLKNFQFPYLRQMGYVNLRCVWVIGCPAEIRPMEDAQTSEVERRDGMPTAKEIYKDSFEQLLPGHPVPEVVAVSCCSQFAVTREAIRRRPREDYIHFLEWLLNTPLEDALSGRVFEFAWHIIFGQEAVHCPSPEACYCNVFGLCGLNCTESECDGRYTLPAVSTLPVGWPKVGWDKEQRPFSGPPL